MDRKFKLIWPPINIESGNSSKEQVSRSSGGTAAALSNSGPQGKVNPQTNNLSDVTFNDNETQSPASNISQSPSVGPASANMPPKVIKLLIVDYHIAMHLAFACDKHNRHHSYNQQYSNKFKGKDSLPTLTLDGYEVYIVEQWACDRKLNRCIISYTGNPAHQIKVYQVELAEDNAMWPKVARMYIEEVLKLHLKPKDTEHGMLYVTNLLSFPSNLKLVPIPDGGDMAKSMELFVANENMRRMGCGGRSVLSIAPLPDLCCDKFRQIFRTSDVVPVRFAVRELVTLVQTCLYYCGLLQARYVDGLLCNLTCRAISKWWDDLGRTRYHTKPSEAALDPPTVAAIVGFVMGIRARLQSLNFKPPKDVFNASEFTATIRQFQKHERLVRTKLLDFETLRKIYILSEKTTDLFGGFAIVRSMKEASGRPRENSMGDLETLELDRLTLHVTGKRARYLWQGKGSPPKEDLFGFSLGSILGGRFEDPYDYDEHEEQQQSENVSGNQINLQHHRPGSGMVTPPNQLFSNDIGPRSSQASPNQPTSTSTSGFGLVGNGKGKKREKIKKYLTKTSTHEYHGRRPSSRGTSDEEIGQSNLLQPLSTAVSARSKLSSPFDVDAEGYSNVMVKRSSDGEIIPTGASFQRLNGNCKRVLTDHIGTGEYVCIMYRSQDDAMAQRIAQQDRSLRRCQLRRSQSFSGVESAILRWEYPICDCIVARAYVSATRTRKRLVEEIEHLDVLASTYGTRIAVMDEFLKKDRFIVKGMRQHLGQVVEKELGLKRTLQDVDLLAARLQYEARMLETKLPDVEESVDTFATRVTELEMRLSRVEHESSSNEGLAMAILRRCMSLFAPG